MSRTVVIKQPRYHFVKEETRGPSEKSSVIVISLDTDKVLVACNNWASSLETLC